MAESCIVVVELHCLNQTSQMWWISWCDVMSHSHAVTGDCASHKNWALSWKYVCNCRGLYCHLFLCLAAILRMWECREWKGVVWKWVWKMCLLYVGRLGLNWSNHQSCLSCLGDCLVEAIAAIVYLVHERLLAHVQKQVDWYNPVIDAGSRSDVWIG